MQIKLLFPHNLIVAATPRFTVALCALTLCGCAVNAARAWPEPQEPSLAQDAGAAPNEDAELLAIRLLPGTSPTNLWERLRTGFALAAPDTPLVAQLAAQYAISNVLDSAGRRAAPLLFLVAEEIEQRGLPLELALIPFVESAFQPAATSPVGAHGPWQFMPYTGKRFGLVQDRLRDERRAWHASTRAALDYLQLLHAQFGDWHLAIAAYNAGEGAVETARRRALAAGVEPRFENLRLPRETREYVPRVFALARLITTQAAPLTPIPNVQALTAVAVSRDMDVKTAVHLSGLTEVRFRQLNPAFNGPLIVAATAPELLLPSEAAQDFAAALARHTGPLATWYLLRLHRAATATALALELGVPPFDLVAANPLPRGHRYRAGASLFVPRDARQAESVPALTLEQINNTALVTEPALLHAVPRQGRGKPGPARRIQSQPTPVAVTGNRAAARNMGSAQPERPRRTPVPSKRAIRT